MLLLVEQLLRLQLLQLEVLLGGCILLKAFVGLVLLVLGGEVLLLKDRGFLLHLVDLVDVIQILLLESCPLLKQLFLVLLSYLSHFRILAAAVLLVLLHDRLHRVHLHFVALLADVEVLLQSLLDERELAVR